LEAHLDQGPLPARQTFLPTGELTVHDPQNNVLKKIPILLDTGAEISFIHTDLVEQLNLSTSDPVMLRLHTFGSEQVQEKSCKRVRLEAWDTDGEPISLELFTHNILTKPFATPPIRDEDIKFAQSLNPPIQLQSQKSAVKPMILLGCDQLWSLVRNDQNHITLPSGLHVIPTRLGHLVTGQLCNTCPKHYENELESTEDDKEDSWERFWTLDSAGTEEFSAPDKELHSIEDKQVWENFNSTIQRREDGYYVRLPWKNVTASLPDNKAIAFHRLVSVWNTLQKDQDLLDQYDGIFREQLNLGILEHVEENRSVEGSTTRVHYIPHQAVLTPHKTTTKIRIVYDASAHYKGCPSLNDVLHRGPVILPSLYGVLLRFRIGRITSETS
uniref:DUF1758 domain-containing protein n=1 Tax=Heligmosomoides polygyrus TaxID=6339 RepID=A0A183FAG8_HELPZ